MALLEVRDLEVRFYTEDGVVTAVDGLSYDIEAGEKFGVVGESGAGKSVASLSLMRLIDSPGRIESGQIRYGKEETVDEFANDFPNRTIDLSEVRAEWDLKSLVEELVDQGVSPSALTGDRRHDDADPATLVRDGLVGFDDLVTGGYATRLGLADREPFIVRDGADSYIEVIRAPDEALRRLRGGHIAMIFQDPQTALNPVYTIGEQIAEAVRVHTDLGDAAVRERVVEMLEMVGIPDAAERYSDYPHQFSGGMQQRAVIATALSCNPDLIIADEPTTALDVTIEAQILELLEELSDETDTAIQLITHDLGVVAGICDRVCVLYAGKPVEVAPVEELYYDPKMPYTVGLMGSIPRIGDQRERLDTIPGTMPDLVQVPPGCSFHPRCPFAEEVCTEKEPPLVDVETGDSYDPEHHDGHVAACLEYTGDLVEGLDYEVRVAEGEGVTIEGRADATANGGSDREEAGPSEGGFEFGGGDDE